MANTQDFPKKSPAFLERQHKGLWGEKIAERELKNRGYKILERRFKTRFGEADLIGQKGNTLAFVEVKHLQSLNQGHPLEAVTSQKITRLFRAAVEYLRQKSKKQAPPPLEFWAIGVWKDSSGIKTQWAEIFPETSFNDESS